MKITNQLLADWLTEYAHFLKSRKAGLYRIRAYRRAAETILGLDQPLQEILDLDGIKGIENISNIGPHLARVLEHCLRTGEFSALDGETDRLNPMRLIAR